MKGLMQETPLIVNQILDYAAKFHGSQIVVSRCVEDASQVTISNYAEIHQRCQQLAYALQRLGVREGGRVATLGWNTIRHFEAWYGIMGLGAICHTLNPRLFVNDLEYIINDAEDCIILADSTFAPILEKLQPSIPSVRAFIFMTDRAHMPHTGLPNVFCYDDLLLPELGRPPFKWLVSDESTACGLCYTSGTTGRPKGVLYSHRSNYLLALIVTHADAMCLGSADTVLPIVPLFHANSWGLVFSTPMTGAALVLPGPYLDGQSTYRMLEDYQVTKTAAVPTVWLGLLDYMDKNGLKLSSLELTCVGGAACPPSVTEAFEERYGVEIRHMWGMTEVSPIGSLGALKGSARQLNKQQRLALKAKQGRPHPFCDMRIVNDAGQPLPHDGKATGNLQVRGAHTIREYFKIGNDDKVDAEGWFDTGDVASIDPEGYMQITDRSKDVIKSGGEWISSIDIENAAVSHPKVMEAAVIGIPDKKWGERPLLIIVEKDNSGPTRQEMLEFLKGKIASWWMPDDVVVVPEIPHTATGKIYKLQLRKDFEGYTPRLSKL